MSIALNHFRNREKQQRCCCSHKSRIAQSLKYRHYLNAGVITDEAGSVTEKLAYDPWGKRRFANDLADPANTLTGVTTRRGYTQQEHMDEVATVNMNGRIYDPMIGRFMSADPFIQAPYELQSYNRYAYVMNNPLARTDPSGYIAGLVMYSRT